MDKSFTARKWHHLQRACETWPGLSNIDLTIKQYFASSQPSVQPDAGHIGLIYKEKQSAKSYISFLLDLSSN